MNRRERRELKRGKLKSARKNSDFEPVKGWEKVFMIALSLLFILASLYIALKDNSIPDDELSTISVTLNNSPEYHKTKPRSVKHILLSTNEYDKEFIIIGETYKATDHYALKSELKAGDAINLIVKKGDMDELNVNSFWGSKNEIYGLSKNGTSYINLELRTELADYDNKFAFFFTVIGLIMLLYTFINTKPLISMQNVIFALSAVILLIIWLAN